MLSSENQTIVTEYDTRVDFFFFKKTLLWQAYQMQI